MEKIIEYREKTKEYPQLFRINKFIHQKSHKTLECFRIEERAFFKNSNILPFWARGIFISPEDNRVIVRGYDKVIDKLYKRKNLLNFI